MLEYLSIFHLLFFIERADHNSLFIVTFITYVYYNYFLLKFFWPIQMLSWIWMMQSPSVILP